MLFITSWTGEGLIATNSNDVEISDTDTAVQIKNQCQFITSIIRTHIWQMNTEKQQWGYANVKQETCCEKEGAREKTPRAPAALVQLPGTATVVSTSLTCHAVQGSPVLL
jgi:hypothetical protein